jgi:hypothetical protein
MSLPDPSLSGMASFPNLARLASRGNRVATLVSAFAFAFSGVSFYETVMKKPRLTAFVPPVTFYARGDGGSSEIFAVPITILNEGARAGTVLSMELTVTEPNTQHSRKHYSAFFGEPPTSNQKDLPSRAFAPLSIQGRSTFTDTIRFLPIGDTIPFTVQDSGNFIFELALITPQPPNPGWLDWLWRSHVAPLKFERNLPYIAQQSLKFRGASLPMYEPSWNPTKPAPTSQAAPPVEASPQTSPETAPPLTPSKP